jgi:hypothetical protein
MRSTLSLSLRDPEVSGNGQPSVTAEHELDAAGTYPSTELTHHSLFIRRMAQALRENLANSRFIANGDILNADRDGLALPKQRHCSLAR